MMWDIPYWFNQWVTSLEKPDSAERLASEISLQKMRPTSVLFEL